MVSKATFAQVFSAVHTLWTRNGDADPRRTLDDINQLLFACGWTPAQYEQRLVEARCNEERFSINVETN